ncbi:hypothetical protein ACFE04_002794 [Oxalis oulophora]
MTSRKIVFNDPSVTKRQPLLQSRSGSYLSPSSSTSSFATSPSVSPPRSRGFAEVAGGTTAECAAICCCCPCGLANILVLAIYKLPAGICRNAIKNKRRKRLMKKGIIPKKGRCKCGCDETELQIHEINDSDLTLFNDYEMRTPEESEKEVFMELEKEMWDGFYETGFWRSRSQREESQIVSR